MSGRILIADDEAQLLTVMTQYLRRLGYEVEAYRTGAESWQAFQAAPQMFALVIADASLPEVAHERLLERMYELNPGLVFLLASGYPFDLASLEPELRARTRFLQKPFAPKMLADAVADLLVPGRDR